MPLVPENVLKEVKDRVTSKFPEMEGIEPRMEKLILKPEPEIYEKLGISFPSSRGTTEVVELQFTTKVPTEDGSEIQRIVRVLVDTTGTILKITTSK